HDHEDSGREERMPPWCARDEAAKLLDAFEVDALALALFGGNAPRTEVRTVFDHGGLFAGAGRQAGADPARLHQSSIGASPSPNASPAASPRSASSARRRRPR